MEKELSKIIKELKKIRGETELLLVEDNILFEQGVKIFLAQRIQEYKSANIDKISNKEPATKKQIAYLKKTGFDGDFSKLTKKEAQVLIKEYIQNQKEEKNEFL